jgi:DNA-binding XRE family transcriptional regulator
MYNDPMVSNGLAEALEQREGRGKTAALAAWVQGLFAPGAPPVLVGGAAVALHAEGAFTTGDLDFVGAVPQRVARELAAAGFEHHGREWVQEEGKVFLEFRAGGLSPGDRAVSVKAEGCSVLVLGREDLIINRLASWATWASPVDGMNAYFLYVQRPGTPDEARLRELAEARGVSASLDALKGFCGDHAKKCQDSESLRRWAMASPGALPTRPARPGLAPAPRRRRPRAYLKWAALRRWGRLPPWEEFTAGYILREAREGAGRTQADLASRLGVTQQAIAQAERWRGNPTAHFFRAWAEACGVEMVLEFTR